MRTVKMWQRDESAFDPYHQHMFVEHDGQLYEARNTLGPGFPMTVRRVDDKRFRSATVDWQDWATVIDWIERQTS